jgi:hypothetical protein
MPVVETVVITVRVVIGVGVFVQPSVGVRAMCTLNVPAGLRRFEQIIAGVDDVVYILNPDGTVYRCPTGDNFSGPTLDCAAARGYAYFVDGFAIYYVDVLAGSHADVRFLTPGEGELPAHGQYGPSLICFYRDRMVLAGVRGDEQNFFMSRSGVHDDFDYGQTDAAAAVAGDLALGAGVGSPIRALMPWRDDILVFGCDKSIWRMIGDIAAGGSIQLVTDAVGVYGPHSWTTDPAGMLYFMGESDFYSMAPAGGVKNLSATRLHQFFAGLDRAQDTVTVQWDATRQGCWIFVSKPKPADGVTTPLSTHLWYDARLDSFWKVQVARAYDPACAVDYSGDTDDIRAVMMGDRSGWIRKFDDSARTDAGTTIESYIEIGPLNPGGDIRDAKLNGLDFILGDLPAGMTNDNWNLDWTLKAGKDAAHALSAPSETRTGTFTTAGDQRPIGLRVAGSRLMLRLANATNDKLWSIDRVIGRFLLGGRRR